MPRAIWGNIYLLLFRLKGLTRKKKEKRREGQGTGEKKKARERAADRE
jgi:hypothetical protein